MEKTTDSPHPSPDSIQVYYTLVGDVSVDQNDNLFSVSLAKDSTVSDFRRQVKQKNPVNSSSFISADLIIYKDRSTYESSKSSGDFGPLGDNVDIKGLGITRDNPLYFLVKLPSDTSQQHPKSKDGEYWYQLVDSNGDIYKNCSCFKVKVDPDADIADFLEAVKAKHPNKLSSFETADLKAYKNETSFKKRKVADLGDEEHLNPRTKLENLNINSNDTIYVVVPVKQMAKWNTIPPRIDYLLDGHLAFVNQNSAVEQLETIHRAKYNRAKAVGGGETFIIPFADHVLGLGKTTFGYNYIKKLCEKYPNSNDDFEKVICSSHTICIRLKLGELVNVCNLDEKMIQLFSDAVVSLMNVPPSIEDETFNWHLRIFTNKYGPIFILFDEIAQAFESENLDIFAQRDLFLSFCRNIISKLFMLKDVFFLLMGRGEYPNCVGQRFLIQRLNLQLLSPEAIEEIIKTTLVSEDHPIRIQQNLNLNEEQVKDVVKVLYEKTKGHPRTLQECLLACKSFDDIEKYTPKVELENLCNLHHQMQS